MKERGSVKEGRGSAKGRGRFVKLTEGEIRRRGHNLCWERAAFSSV